ncbi:MAG: hypothetical protein R2754_13995 [Microthrixaceae bacterium]
MRNPTVLVLLGLAVVWALVLTPDLLRMYRQSTARRPTGLRSVTHPVVRRAGTHGASPMARSYSPRMSRTQAQQRRAMVLFALMVLCVVTLMAGVALGGTAWVVHVSLDVLLVGYVFLLANRAQVARASQASRSARAARRAQPVPSYLRGGTAPAQRSPQLAGAVGEVYYLDDVRPGNAVAGYTDGYADQPAAYAPDGYDRYEGDSSYEGDYAYEGDYGSTYEDEWMSDEGGLRRSVGW